MPEDPLSYSYLKDKAAREIDKLEEAQKELDKQKATDAALNAAFSVFHLLRWKDKESPTPTQKGERELAKDSGNPHLGLLNDIVSHNKHAYALVEPLSDGRSEVQASTLSTGGITRSLTNPSTVPITGSKTLAVKFGNKKAVDVLKGAYKYFEED